MENVNTNSSYLNTMKLAGITLVPVILLFAVGLTPYFSNKEDENRTILTVNQEPVSEAEMLHIMSELRPSVFSYFSRRYGASDGLHFWTTKFNGEVPFEILKQRTIEKLKSIKIQQILMRQHGLVTDISYSGFLRSLEIENNRRRKASMDNVPVYGPIQFETRVYYDYLFSERTEKLKQVLSSAECAVTEGEIRDFYQSHRSDRYAKPVYIEIEKIILRSGEDFKGVPKNRTGWMLAMSEIRRRLLGGETAKSVISDLKSSESMELAYEQHVLDGSDLRRQASLYFEVDAHVKELRVGEISEIIQGEKELSVIRIAESKSDRYRPFEEVQAQIRRDLINSKYEQMIGQLIESAEVDVVEEIESSRAVL